MGEGADRARVRIVIRDHAGYGFHRALDQPFTYITMLRDPADRIISHYYFVLRKAGHYLYKEVTSRNMTLRDDVVSGISSELDNGQTRLVSGANGVRKGLTG